MSVSRSAVKPFAAALVVFSACLFAPGSGASVPGVSGRIAFFRQNHALRNRIFIMNADGTGQRPLTRLADDALYPALSPDRKRIAFIIGGGDDPLAVMNRDGSHRRILIRYDAKKPSWSPNGRGIAFETGFLPSSVDYVNADGTGHRVLRANAGDPAWSPDGKTIAFTRARDDLWLMNASGKGARQLLRKEGLVITDPAWSPDGKRIAFVVVGVDGTFDGTIFIVNADGSDPHRLLPTNDLDQEEPAWSPDGTKLVFAGWTKPTSIGGKYPFARSLYLINADGSGQTQLTRGTRDFDPSWR